MRECCATCGQPLPGASLLDQLRDAAKSGGHIVSVDDAVDRRCAALLLGVSESALAHWQSPSGATRGPPSYPRGGRVRYRLADPAAWLERARPQ